MKAVFRVALAVLGVASAAAVGAAVWYFATLYRAGEAPRGSLALVGATVLVGEDLQPLPGGTVVIRDGRIVAVGGPADVSVPADASRLDLSGLTLIPGLVDVHVHLGGAGVADALRFAPSARRALLSHGVTTIRCLGNDLGWTLELRGLLARGELGRILDAWPEGALRTLAERRLPLTPTLAVTEGEAGRAGPARHPRARRGG